MDGDGFTTCGGDCCDSTECSNPALVNPGAFEVPGNGVDDDCDGMVDNAAAANCDQGLTSNSTDPMDYAKAIDLCQTATMSDKKWGVISATWSLTNGSGTPDAKGHAIRPHFGTGIQPLSGACAGRPVDRRGRGQGRQQPGLPRRRQHQHQPWPELDVPAPTGSPPTATPCPTRRAARPPTPRSATPTTRRC